VKLHSVCLRPGGMNRGGVRHERLKTFDTEAFSPHQMREMLSEPELALIVGGEPMGAAHLAEVEAAIAEEETKAKAEAEKAGKAKKA